MSLFQNPVGFGTAPNINRQGAQRNTKGRISSFFLSLVYLSAWPFGLCGKKIQVFLKKPQEPAGQRR
jgi:hypothetical protein